MQTDDEKPPTPPVTFTLNMGADDQESLSRELRRLADQVDRRELTRGAWGGGGSSGDYVLTVTDKTAEQYRDELQEWAMNCRKRKSEEHTND